MKVIKIILLVLLIYILHTVVETFIINKELNTFKQSAVYQYTVDSINYYKVDSEGGLGMPVSNSGDVLVSRKSGNPNLIIRDLISFFTGGHAALVLEDNKTIEIFGNLDQGNVVNIYENDWLETEREVIGMKVNNSQVLDYSLYIEQTYNWFPFYDNPAKRYCTDLITKIYDSSNCTHINIYKFRPCVRTGGGI